jgi:hypothetical protein
MRNACMMCKPCVYSAAMRQTPDNSDANFALTAGDARPGDARAVVASASIASASVASRVRRTAQPAPKPATRSFQPALPPARPRPVRPSAVRRSGSSGGSGLWA